MDYLMTVLIDQETSNVTVKAGESTFTDSANAGATKALGNAGTGGALKNYSVNSNKEGTY
ncbi:hypothetical protein AB7009_05620 [Citrobacter werkmanii]|uniref:Uncharacterized protein n=1 Tax=Citrobacter freundii TaxID=546 RepID=A0AAN4JFX5_CITFR|nr:MULTISPECIES: hypothetical protein [Citrobacter freundii complex]EKW2112257.1 hypothetical protein [Citrobacter freundii]MBA7790298.1 hypothetical protein [Citrobacter freundii]MBA7991050.1 hypothetical protein [Citrobacter freundii]MBM7249509.1 hypothetical protein [Citrobacter freundii]MBM7290728.1 hypothetical protein [Citrobacter freundii]